MLISHSTRRRDVGKIKLVKLSCRRTSVKNVYILWLHVGTKGDFLGVPQIKGHKRKPLNPTNTSDWDAVFLPHSSQNQCLIKNNPLTSFLFSYRWRDTDTIIHFMFLSDVTVCVTCFCVVLLHDLPACASNFVVHAHHMISQ